jgi:hypothetical protein
MSGVDNFNTKRDNDLDIFIHLFNDPNSYIFGYTFSNTYKTWINKRWLDYYRDKPWIIAGNMAHEYCHNVEGINFHTSYPHPLRKCSAPYAVGYAVRDLGEVYKNQIDQDMALGRRVKVYVCKKRWWWPFWDKCEWIDRIEPIKGFDI